jgi:tetratricopeptide (TPR) repeat protein
MRDFEGVQLLQFGRTISLEGTVPEEREQQGHARARQWLEESGADVLIWGLVLRQEGQSAPRLYWTTLHERKRAKEPYQPANFKLPDLFWNDLAEVLRLVVATHYSTFSEQKGRFIADQLMPFITRVRRLLDKNLGRQGWSDVQFFLGNALSTLRTQTGMNQPLEEAATAYCEALKEWPRERVPLDWAMTQNNLGNALTSLGEREPGTAKLEEAVAAYREALQERTRERVPLHWAITQNNLGSTLRVLGERKKDATLICEALGKQLMAWKVFSTASPYYVSVTVNALKITLTLLMQPFDRQVYHSCLAQHEDMLKRIGLL